MSPNSPLLELTLLRTFAPETVDSELRPLVERLQERRKDCAGCGRTFLQKRAHSRRRTFCSDRCRFKARS